MGSTSGTAGGVAVLVGIRSCIERVFAELLPRRPGKGTQDPTPNPSDKLLSIGTHCGISGLARTYFQPLAIQADDLRDKLSGGKGQVITRPIAIDLFHQAVTFLDAFLSGVDERKLK